MTLSQTEGAWSSESPRGRDAKQPPGLLWTMTCRQEPLGGGPRDSGGGCSSQGRRPLSPLCHRTCAPEIPPLPRSLLTEAETLWAVLALVT